MRSTLVSSRVVVASIGLMISASMLAGAQQGAAVRTAAQARKNIQILKDIPADQLIPAMRTLSTELGVECEFCHVGDRAVDTPNKQTARKMMVMMMALNKENFDGRQVVTCYTCHKGNHVPVSAVTPTGLYSAEGPTFYKPTAPLAGATDDPMAEAYKEAMTKEQAALAALPKPEQILEKYVAALGGEQALRKVTARAITSTTELAADVRGGGATLYVKEEQYFKAPNLYVATFQMPNGQTARGFDGTDAWNQNANGVVSQAKGTDLLRAKRAADLYEGLNLKQAYTRLTLQGIEKVGDREAYVVVGFPAGDNPEHLYFDTQTGLLLRKGTYNATVLGDYTIQTDYDDYRDVGGVKIPFLIRTISVSPADTTVIHVDKVENNPTVDASKFAKPASKPPRAPAGQ